jgi:hypothetical protein
MPFKDPVRTKEYKKDYMKVYMQRKRAGGAMATPPEHVVLEPDPSVILHHNKAYRRVLRYMVHKVQWLQWRQCFDEVLAEFDERKDAYIAYHSLD